MEEIIAGIIGAIIGAVGCIVAALISRGSAKTVKKKEMTNRHDTCHPRFCSREELELEHPFDQRVQLGLGIKEIRILNYACNAILSPHIVDYIGMPSNRDFSDTIDKLVVDENIRLTIVITAPMSMAAEEALTSQKIVNLNTDTHNRNQVFFQSFSGIQNRIDVGGSFYHSYQSGRFNYRITQIALPYGLFQVKYNDPSKDHIKIDLYSPYISRESKRRSIFIYKATDPENYRFFEENFDNIFKNSLSLEEENIYLETWLNHSSSYSESNT